MRARSDRAGGSIGEGLAGSHRGAELCPWAVTMFPAKPECPANRRLKSAIPDFACDSPHGLHRLKDRFDALQPVIYKTASMSVRDSERYFDLRTVHRYVNNGTVTRAEYDEFLTTLPDVADQIMERSAGGDDDGYEVQPADGRAQQEQPAQVAPAQAAPAQVAAQAAPAQAAPAQVAPAQAAPAQAAPTQVAPTQVAPAQAVPAQVAPTQVVPVQAAPVQAAPVQAAPAPAPAPTQVVPAQAAPVQADPASAPAPAAPEAAAPQQVEQPPPPAGTPS